MATMDRPSSTRAAKPANIKMKLPRRRRRRVARARGRRVSPRAVGPERVRDSGQHLRGHQSLRLGGRRRRAGAARILRVPLVVRLAGTNVEQGRRIVNESGLPIIAADTLLEAAQKAGRRRRPRRTAPARANREKRTMSILIDETTRVDRAGLHRRQGFLSCEGDDRLRHQRGGRRNTRQGRAAPSRPASVFNTVKEAVRADRRYSEPRVRAAALLRRLDHGSRRRRSRTRLRDIDGIPAQDMMRVKRICCAIRRSSARRSSGRTARASSARAARCSASCRDISTGAARLASCRVPARSATKPLAQTQRTGSRRDDERGHRRRPDQRQFRSSIICAASSRTRRRRS